MRRYMRVAEKKPDERDAYKFLMKKGLKRDRANYVEFLIRMRQEAAMLRKNMRDSHVADCIDGLCEVIGEEVSEIYEMQSYEDEG